MTPLEKELGKVLRAKDVAKYFGIDEKMVREYYQEIGGMRLGPRKLFFFERRIIDAIQTRTETRCPSAERNGTQERESVLEEEGRCSVGSGNEAETSIRVEREDKHGLLD